MNELRITLQKKQKEAFKLSQITPMLFMGGAKGGGKSYLVRAKELYLRMKHPGTKGLIVRKTHPELLSNHIRKFFEEYPQTRSWFNKSEKAIQWPNGSITEFSYLQSEDDVYTYQGREYENISIDESTQHSWNTIQILRSSLRTTKKDIVPTMLLTGNPGGLSHADHKRVFIDRQFRSDENPEDYKFVQAFVYDNTALMKADPKYIDRLKSLPPHLVKAYLEGDWNIFAGQMFAELQRSIHVIDPIQLPPGTRYFSSFDPGYNHPFSFIIFAVVPEGTVYVTQHYTDRLKMSRELVVGIKEHAKDRELQIHAGHDLWYPGRGGGPSQVEELIELGLSPSNGFYFIKAKTDRESGVRQIHKYLNPKNYPDLKPRCFFFRNCADVYDAVAQMQIDPKKPEDVMKIDADDNGYGGDDVYDSFRYGLMSRAYPAVQEPPKPAQFTGKSILDQLMEESYV